MSCIFPEHQKVPLEGMCAHEPRASFAVATIINCFFTIWHIPVVTHPQTLKPNLALSPSVTSWMTSQAACHMRTQMIQSFLERIFLVVSEIFPFTLCHLPYPSLSHSAFLLDWGPHLGGVYMSQSFLSSATFRCPSYFSFTYYMSMTCLLGFLSDSDFGV